MKIGLVTQFNFINYGNRLQNWATDVILKKLGHEVVSLVYSPARPLILLNNAMKAFPITPLGKRMRKFRAFTKNNINTKYINGTSINKLKKLYGTEGETPLDAVVIGSDQTWNPAYIVNSDKNFGRFVDKEKRMSYSTSFGVSVLPKKCIDDFKVGLNEIKNISVRETAGSKIVEQLTGKACPVHLDPSMMIGKKEWHEATANINKVPKEKYIFCYFLQINREYRKWVKNLAKKHNLKIVDINKYGNKYFSSDPFEFVKLIQNAELVCTNSFHGHAFSICLEKPFISFPPTKSTNSRVKTILGLTGLEERNYKTVKEEDIFKIDYTNVTPIIQRERERAIEYLKNSLEEIKGDKNDAD